MKKTCFAIVFIYTCLLFGNAQTKECLELYIIDTIVLDAPVVVRFIENKDTDSSIVKSLLISKDYLDSVKFNKSISYRDFLLEKNCYLLFTSSRFSCLLNNLLYHNPKLEESSFFVQLQNLVRKSEKDNIWVNIDKFKKKFKKYNGWEYSEITTRKFFFCLVSGKALRRCQSIDEITIKNMDNTYFKILTPFINND